MENLGYLPLDRIEKDRIIPTEQDYIYTGDLLQELINTCVDF